MNQKRIFTTRKNVLSVAVASCFGVVAGQALAVVDISVATPTGVTKFAKELPSNTATLTNAANNLDIKNAVPAGYAVSAANPLYVKLNLTQGARFAAAPTLMCGTAAAAIGSSGVLTLGGAATSYVVFAVDSGMTVSGTCSAGVGNLTISGLNNVAVSATVEYKAGLSNTVTGLSNSYVTFVRGMSAAINSADGTVVVDATSGSDAFTVASNRGVSALATLGTVQWTMVGTSAVIADGASNVSAGDVLTTASITINGPAIAAALAANGNSGVFLDAAASACTTKSYTVSASATNSVTFNNVSLTNLSAGVNVCINVSGGTTVITTGQFTASVGGVAVTNVTADFSAASSAMETVTANGVSRNAYFINASTSAAKTSVLRIINTGAVSAAFTATAYAVDDGIGGGATVAGVTLGTANSALGTLSAGGALSLTSAQLESKLGFTPSSGTTKYRVVISAGTDAAEVLNYTKDTATGAIVLSQSQTN